MIKRLILILLLVAPVCAAQIASKDDYGARSDISTSAHAHRIAVTCSKAATTETCTPSGFVSATNNSPAGTNATTYSMTLGAPNPSETYTIAINEPWCGDSFGNSMNYSFQSTSMTQGADHLTSFNTSTGQMTLTTFASSTESSTSGFVTPCKYFVPPGGIVTPFGTGQQLASPEKHWAWVIGLGQVCFDTSQGCPGSATAWHTALVNKYGVSGLNCTAGSFITIDLKNVGYVMSAEDSSTGADPNQGACTNFQPMPNLSPGTTPAPSNYSGDDLNGCAPQIVIDLKLVSAISGINNQHEHYDWFAPNYLTHATCYWGISTNGYAGRLAFYEAPSNVGYQYDDTDGVDLGDPGVVWAPKGTSAAGIDTSYVVFTSSPHESFQITTHYNATANCPCVLPDTTVYTKKLSASAPSNCPAPGTNALAPCTEADYLRNEYSNTIASLNTAWGGGANYGCTGAAASNNPFGSCELAVTSESIGTGNGSLTSFSHTFANGNVTPTTVQIFETTPLGATFDIAGDCPHVLTNVTCGGSVGGGTVRSDRAWFANAFFPAGRCIVDSNNDEECYTTGGKTGASPPTWPAVASCPDTVTNDGIAVAKCIGSSISSTSTVTYGATSSVALTTANALQTNVVLTTNYTYGGWGTSHPNGEGVQDTNGSEAWMGTNKFCMVNFGDWQANHVYNQWDVINNVSSGSTQIAIVGGQAGASVPGFTATPGAQLSDGSGALTWMSEGTTVCGGFYDSGGTYPSAGAGADMVAYRYQDALNYYKSNDTLFRSLFPDWLDLGIDYLGSGGFKEALQAAQLYTDGQYVGNMVFDSSLDPLTIQNYKWITTYYTHPTFHEVFWQTSQSQQGTCTGLEIPYLCFSTQAARAAEIKTFINNMLHTTTNSGAFSVGGYVGWGNIDFQSRGFGCCKTWLDNLYDGVEDVTTASVTCGNGVGNLCGSESAGSSWTGVNSITGANSLQAAYQQWLMGASTPPSGAATKSIMMAKIDPAWIAAETHYTGGEKR